MKNKYILLGLSCLAALCSCSDDKAFEPDYLPKITSDHAMTSTVNVADKHQVIDGFASSDAWTMDYIGKYWSNNAKEGIAKLLFSQKIERGNPEGIGLSMWRVNLGGGTAEQGEASGITDKTRRVECFLTQNGTYDWNKSSGQQYFMQKAKEYGCNNFVLFSNTPPVQFTVNGKGSGDWWNNNLREDCFDDFADFLATVAKHFSDNGYNISYISPLNEPQYSWGGDGQEGCSWQHVHVAKMARALNESLKTKGPENTMMLLAEAAKVPYLYTTDDSWADRANVIPTYFKSDSEHYLGDLERMPKLICAHSYWWDKTWDVLFDSRTKARAEADKYGLKLYQTEWSMLGEGYEDYENYDQATYMDLALSMAKVLHHDLVTASMNSWAYWTTASQEVYSQKSRFYMIRLIPTGGDYGNIADGGTYESSKNLWVLGNYSLFVRTGYHRVDLNIPEGDKKFFGSAYISPEEDKLVVVYTNINDESIQMETSIEGLNKQVVSMRQYVTSSTSNLNEVDEYLKGYIPAKSVVTMVYDLK